MPLASIVAAALTTPAARVWSLTVGGLDVSKEPANPARYGADWQTLKLRLAAPGQASSMTWDVDDYQKVLTPIEGMEVRLQRLGQVIVADGVAVDAAWFLGTLEVAEAENMNVGRVWHLRATGVDAIPDWTVTDYALTFPAGSSVPSCVQAIAAACSNTGPLNASGSAVGSVLGHPIDSVGPILVAATTIAAGTSMRRAIEQVASAASWPFGSSVGYRCTVDMYYGLRLWLAANPIVTPDGDRTVALGPLGGGGFPPTAAGRYTRDGTTAIRQVVVNGAGGVTARVSDGSGVRGRTAVISDQTLTTAAQCQTAAAAYLSQHTTNVRGTVAGETFALGLLEASMVTYKLSLVDGETGATGTYEFGGIDATFDGSGRVSIQMTYGGVAPTPAALIRRMAGQPLAS